MQLTIDIGYDQLFEMVRQLPPWEKERLFQENQFSTATPIPHAQEIEQRRQEALRLAMECPVAAPEEIEEYRKHFERIDGLKLIDNE